MGLPWRSRAAVPPSRLRTGISPGRLPAGVVLRIGRAVALLSVLLLADSLGEVPLVPYLLLWVLQLATGFHTPTRLRRRLEFVGALAVVVVAGDAAHLLLPYLAVLTAAIGRQEDLLHGVAAGCGLAVGMLGPTLWSTSPEVWGDPLTTAPVLAFLPLIGATAGMWARVVEPPSGRAVLKETNTVLKDLLRLSESVPGTLSVNPIIQAVVKEVAESTGSPLVAMYAGEDTLELRASEGSVSEALPDALAWSDLGPVDGQQFVRLQLIDLATVRPVLRPLAAITAHWTFVPLFHEDQARGILLIAGTVNDRAGHLRELAEDTAIALDNARLFERARSEAADTMRNALAHDLHDGVAQSLTHLRLELQLLATQLEDPALVEDVHRLARVASRATSDLRATIDVLRSGGAGEDVVDELARYFHDLDGLNGARLTFEPSVRVKLPPEVATQLRYVAQEAVSNAVRHSNAGQVLVTFTADDRSVDLMVEDDGVGLPDAAGRRSDGVGLTAMSRRAARLGGVLEVSHRPGGGTRVHLHVPNITIPARPPDDRVPEPSLTAEGGSA